MLENENMIDFLRSLKDMSSDHLSRLIQDETEKEAPNDDLVLMALDILEDREKENSIELGPKGKAAWKKYQSKIRSRQRETVWIWKPLMQVASVLLVITMLFALLPTRANAETWWERLARWTDEFFSFFNPNESEKSADEYVFQTDNQGLQQVYDAVVELGIVEPVVPMWLPEKYELKNYIVDCMPTKKSIVAVFSNGVNEIILQINMIGSETVGQYFKEEGEIKPVERYGTVFRIFKNTQNWCVAWAKENIECSIFIDCQEEILYEIIESIYRWRIIE